MRKIERTDLTRRTVAVYWRWHDRHQSTNLILRSGKWNGMISWYCAVWHCQERGKEMQKLYMKQDVKEKIVAQKLQKIWQYFRTENITYYFLKLKQDLFNWQDCLILAPELIQLWPIFFCCTFFSLFIPLVRRPLEKIATPKICSIVHALPNTTKLRNKLAAFRLVVVILIARALNRFVMADAHEPPNIPNAEKKIRAINFWMREKEYTIVSSGNDWCLKNSLYVPFEKKKKIIPGLISFILYATQSMIANETTFSRAWKWSCPSEWRFIVTSDQLLYDGG